MRFGPKIHYNAGIIATYYIHYNAGADELAFMHGNRFSPSEDFFVNPFSSLLTIMQDITTYMYVHVHVRTLVQVLLEEANTPSGTVGFTPEKHNEPQLFQ